VNQTNSTPVADKSAGVPSQESRQRARNPLVVNIVGLVIAIAVLYLVLSILAPGFLSLNNQLGLLRNASLIGIVAGGMTLVIIAGEIDVSIGPAVAFSTVVFAKALTQWGLSTPLAILLTLVAGLVWGAFVGVLRAHFNVPSFIGTLGLWNILGGLALFTTGALPVTLPSDNSTTNLLGGSLLGFPTPAWIMIILLLLFGFIAAKTKYGRSVYAVGGNASAARLAGIDVKRVRVLIFMTTGILSALAGILLASRIGSGSGSSAVGMEFNVIAAVVVGGAAMSGGSGSMFGSFLGVFLITLISDGLVLLGVDPYMQTAVTGIVIVVAVLVNVTLSKRSASSESS